MRDGNGDWPKSVERFIGSYRNLLEGAEKTSDLEIEAERKIFRELLAAIDLEVGPEDATELPVCRVLDAVLDAAPSDTAFQMDLVAASRGVMSRARWVNKYAPSQEHATLFENFAFCDFVGPQSAQVSYDVTLGFVLLGPDTNYPFHEHPARELYYVVSGTAGWATDFGDYAPRPPGCFLLHKENQPHAMRTYAEPLLAVSAWRGETQGRSRFSERSA